MSSTWQPYVDENLVGSGKLTKAMIVGLADGAVWAESESFCSADERAALVRAFDDASAMRQEGMRIAGQKFILLQSGDGRSLYAKKGEEGVIAVRTKQCALVATYAAPTVPGEAAKVVESLADYLISVDF